MRKIPTVFQRDPDDRGRVTREVNPAAAWVLAGEGRATRKSTAPACAATTPACGGRAAR